MRETIIANVVEEHNHAGCLIGEVDEYMKAFDAQKAEMLQMFDKNDYHWQQKIESCDQGLESEIAEMQDLQA